MLVSDNYLRLQSLKLTSFGKSLYLQGQTTECVEHMITVWCEESGDSSEVNESYLKDPELRQWHLPARGMLLHKLYREKGKQTWGNIWCFDCSCNDTERFNLVKFTQCYTTNQLELSDQLKNIYGNHFVIKWIF